MTSECMYVLLELHPSMPNRAKLEKYVPKEYAQKTFSDVIGYLLDPSPNRYNKQPYSSAQQESVMDIGDMLALAMQSQAQALLKVHARLSPTHKVGPYELYDPIEKYRDTIFCTREVPSPTGGKEPMKCLDLILTHMIVGG